MTPSSEQLEAFVQRLGDLDRELVKLRGAEVTKTSTIEEVRSLAKEWLRLSAALRAADAVPAANLDSFDGSFKELLTATSLRTRSSAYRSKLDPILSKFVDQVVIPTIRHEGNPAQVASRQLLAEFDGVVTPEELTYLEEAARCLASRCNRAAIILLWAAAIARFHSAIEKIGFNAFNAAVDLTEKKKGNPFGRVSKATVSSLPELQRAKEFDLLVVGMELWKYDLQVWGELDRLLGTRNGAAHPGMAKPTALDVQQFAAKVATYVFKIVPK